MFKFTTKVLLFFILSVGLYANMGLSQKHLVSISPESASIGQPENTQIKIVFDESIISKSVKKHTIKLKLNKQKIDGITTLINENTLLFVPNQRLSSGVYQVIVKRVKLDLLKKGTNYCNPRGGYQRFIYWLCSLYYDNPEDCSLCQYVCGNNGKKVKTKKIKYTFIVDETPPVITLNGENDIKLFVGDEYEELGANAIDDLDGNVSVSILGNVDTSVEGNYSITYTAVDKSGNSSNINRGVTVERDLTIQEITKEGNITKATKLFIASQGGEIEFDDGVRFIIEADILKTDTLISVSKDDNNTFFNFEPDGLIANGNMKLEVPVMPYMQVENTQILNAYIMSDESPLLKSSTETFKAEKVFSSFSGDLETGEVISLEFSHFSLLNLTMQDSLYIALYIPSKYLQKGDIINYLSSENYDKNGSVTDESSFDWFPGHTAMISSPLGENCIVTEETSITSCDMIESIPDFVRLYNLFEGKVGAYADGHIYMGARRPKLFTLSSSEQDSVVSWAKAQIGKPWEMVNSPDSQGPTTFSCVGLVESAYESIGKGMLSEGGGDYSRYFNAAMPLSMYNKTKPVDEITEDVGNSIEIRVNPIYAFITNRETHAYDDYRNIGIHTPSNFSFTAINLPTGATFDNQTGMFEWNNIPQSYANSSLTITFEIKGDYSTLFSTSTKTVIQDLTIHVGGTITPPIVQICPSDYFKYYNTGTLDELLEKGNKDVGVSDGNKHQVKELQLFLEALGIDVGNNGTDGWFGNDTEKAVMAFQKAKGLTETGKIDVDTQTIINANCHDKIN